jgi:hypothetical protein
MRPGLVLKGGPVLCADEMNVIADELRFSDNFISLCLDSEQSDD